MNDNTSNTPDNASRPGNPRNRDRNGRFIKRRKDNGESKSVTELVVEATVPEPGSVEEAKAWPLAGSKGDITVGEFLALRDQVMEDPLDAIKKSVENALGNRPNITVEVREVDQLPTRIGQHFDVENKTTAGHTRPPKIKRTNKNDQSPAPDNRRNMLYQIRTLPNNRGYGLFYADGVELDEVDTKSKTVIVKHWLGENWYQAIDAGAARVFTTADAARKFRREHFKVTVDDENVKRRRDARHARQKAFREIGASLRHPSHTTKNKTERKPRKLRDDLFKLYDVIDGARTQ